MREFRYDHNSVTGITTFDESGHRYEVERKTRGKPTVRLKHDDVLLVVDNINLDSERERKAYAGNANGKSETVARELMVLSELYAGENAKPVAKRPAARTSGFNRTDMGNAERLVAKHGDDLLYAPLLGKWFGWDGKRWRMDDTDEVFRRAMATARSIWDEISTIDDGDQRKEMAAFAARSEQNQRIKAMVELAGVRLAIRPDEMDADPFLFNVANGTLDLRTFELQPHRRDDRITKISDIEYDPDAAAPTFEALIDQVFGGDAEIIRFVQQYAGYCLTGSTNEQVLSIWHGPTGSNGKSTLLNGFMSVAGDYSRQTATDTFMTRRAGGVPNDIAALKGARLVAAVESEEGQRFSESLVKQLTGGDRISARFMRAEWFEFVPEFKVILVTNNKPDVKESAHAFWRRVRLVPFNVTFAEDQQDKELPDKLRDELPGILAWTVRGCMDWRQNGLTYPAAIRSATEGYRREQDELASWFEDCCFEDPDALTAAGELYRNYVQWARRTGLEEISQIALGKRLKERGYEAGKDRDGRFWKGVGIRDAHSVTHFTTVTHCDTENDISGLESSSNGLYENMRHNASQPPNASQDQKQCVFCNRALPTAETRNRGSCDECDAWEKKTSKRNEGEAA